MFPHGQPQQHPDDHSCWWAHAAHHQGQQANGSTLVGAPPYFLFYDPHTIPQADIGERLAELILNHVHVALDAQLLPQKADVNQDISSTLEQTTDPVVEDGHFLPSVDDELPNINSLF